MLKSFNSTSHTIGHLRTRCSICNELREFMLLDHYRSPLKSLRRWTAFHSRWAGNLAVALDLDLPDEWFAEPQIQWIEDADAAFVRKADAPLQVIRASGVAQLDAASPDKVINFTLAGDSVEVRVYRDAGETALAGVIELITPSNKDRPESRAAFISKCDNYLRDAIGLAMVDVVTDNRTNLHAGLMERLGQQDQADDALYTSAYRPVRRDDNDELDIWYEPLRLGGTLPAMPLFLRNGPKLQINLADTYALTCEELKINRITDSK